MKSKRLTRAAGVSVFGVFSDHASGRVVHTIRHALISAAAAHRDRRRGTSPTYWWNGTIEATAGLLRGAC